MSRRLPLVVLTVLALCTPLVGLAGSAAASAPAGTSAGPLLRPAEGLTGARQAGLWGPERQLPVGRAVQAASGDRLTITYRKGPEAQPERHSLHCRPVGGDHPSSQAACEVLETHSDPFAPVPKDAICTRIYGGAHTAQVTGIWRGQQVDATFRRSGGCEIARWDALIPLLPEVR